jgi:Ca2+-binding EF-hand superfamily protein
MPIRSLVLAIGVVALAAPAFAQQTPEQREAVFTAADKNKDGKLDKAEWMSTLPEQAKAAADQLWGRLDADGDGFITKDQFLALRAGPRPG